MAVQCSCKGLIKIKNTGKILEQQWAKSVPDYVLLCRLPDAAQSFGGSSKLRFSRKNPFDYIMWDSKNRILYAIELKTVKGKSISFERSKDEDGEIHHHQIAGLSEWSKFDNTICGFVIEFREIEKTVFIEINEFNHLMSAISKKSFNYDDLTNLNIRHNIIPQKKARTRYTYDVDGFLSSMKS